MLHRFRSRWLAGGGALLLVLSMSGLAAAASLVSDTTTHEQDAAPPSGDVTPAVTFTDLNGNGIDDTCEIAVAPDSVVAAAALVAADLDGNGTISVSEAARSGWIGGPNCNHGGYVSSVAKTSTDPSTDTTDPAPAVCPVVAPVVAPTDGTAPVVDTAPNAHGLAVSTVAQSDAVGGKNCNHGGAVSAAAKAAHGLKPDQAAKRAAHLAKHPGKGHGGQD